MSSTKKLIRAAFREAVFARDKHACRGCGLGSTDLDAHHITDRNLMPHGGYVAENGISLCTDCHKKAEEFHRTGVAVPGYSPDELYEKIGSSPEKATKASRRLSKYQSCLH